jgi:hypothetical protein
VTAGKSHIFSQREYPRAVLHRAVYQGTPHDRIDLATSAPGRTGMAHKLIGEALSRVLIPIAMIEKFNGLTMTVLAVRPEVGTVAYGRENQARHTDSPRILKDELPNSWIVTPSKSADASAMRAKAGSTHCDGAAVATSVSSRPGRTGETDKTSEGTMPGQNCARGPFVDTTGNRSPTEHIKLIFLLAMPINNLRIRKSGADRCNQSTPGALAGIRRRCGERWWLSGFPTFWLSGNTPRI